MKLASTARRSCSRSSTLRIFSAASPASSAAGDQANERPSRTRVTACFSSSRLSTVITVVYASSASRRSCTQAAVTGASAVCRTVSTWVSNSPCARR
jgi:hypothetical protein